jgi:hypothetical protein
MRTITRTLAFAATAVLAVIGASVVDARTYNYSCTVDGKAYPLQVNDTNMSLKWRGKQYGLNALTNPDLCGKGGWHAEGNGTSFDFCYATKGVASIEDKKGGVYECNQSPSERR